MFLQAWAEMKQQCGARLAAQQEAHAAEVAPLRQHVADARARAESQAEQTRATADETAALKVALAVVHKEQRVRPVRGVLLTSM